MSDTSSEDLRTCISRGILRRMREISVRSYRENQHTHSVVEIHFSESRAGCATVGKHGIARQATDDNIIRSMRFACWIN